MMCMIRSIKTVLHLFLFLQRQQCDEKRADD
jgi:hypothetical protein